MGRHLNGSDEGERLKRIYNASNKQKGNSNKPSKGG